MNCETLFQWNYNSVKCFVSFQVTPVKVSLDDLDDLINALSPEELKELSLVDPDVRIVELQTMI